MGIRGLAAGIAHAARGRMFESSISQAFHDLMVQSVALEGAWTCERERSGLHHALADVRHHVCHALAALDGLEDAAAFVLVHEAYLSVINLGQLLRSAAAGAWAERSAIADLRARVDQLLDEFGPHATRADVGLRRCLLDDVPLERVIAELS
jgi:hypothetical protein